MPHSVDRTWPADWEERLRGAGCPMCAEGRPDASHGGQRILAGRVSDAYLQRSSWATGYTIVIWRGRHVAELTELTSEELASYWSEVARVAGALQQHYRPAKLNYEVLGNSVPHVHTHIVPRYVHDAAPGRPLAFPEEDPPDRPAEEVAADAEALRRLL